MDDVAAELAAERASLAKANAHIAEGQARLQRQRDALDGRRTAGHGADEAERLATLLRETLDEWERHRVLIHERIAHLERKARR